MTTDLRDALRALHDDARRGTADLPTRPLVTRARRRRTLVRTGYGAAGLGTAAAVAVGGVALTGRLGRPTPPPPAVTTTAPVPSPTPSETHAAAPSPTPAWTPTPAAPFQPDLSLCGTDLDTTQGDLTAMTTDPQAVDPGAPLLAPLEVYSASPGGSRVTLTPLVTVLTEAIGFDTDQTRLRVVGVAGQALPGPAARVLDPAFGDPASKGGEALLPLTMPFVMCPGEPGAGGPPPKGAWNVWTQVQLIENGKPRAGWAQSFNQVGEATPPPSASAPPAPAASVPAPVFLPEGTARYADWVDQSNCVAAGSTVTLAGSRPTPTDWSATNGTVTATATARLEDGNLVIGLHLVNTGPALTNVSVRYPTYYLTNDTVSPGRITGAGNVGEGVKTPSQGTTSVQAVRWTTVSSWPQGGALDLETASGTYTCTFVPARLWTTVPGPSAVYPSTAITVGGETTTVRAPAVTLDAAS